MRNTARQIIGAIRMEFALFLTLIAGAVATVPAVIIAKAVFHGF